MNASAFKMHAAFRWTCLALIAAGLAYRVGLAWRLPVGYDEVFVIALGLEEIREGGAAQWIEVPLRRSAAITPLWWWLMAAPTMATGQVSLAAIRAVPLVLGVLTPLAAWLAARKRFGRDAALLLAALIAISDVLAFSNVRGEYFESLLVPLAVVAAVLVGEERRPLWKGLTWLTLVMTFFGKGLVIVAFALLAEFICLFYRRRNSGTAHGVRGLLLALVIMIVPVLGYFLLADRYLAGLTEFKHASLDSKSVWALAYDTTLGYSQTRAHMVAGARQATLVLWDGFVWPTTCLLAMPLLALTVWTLCKTCRRAWSQPCPASCNDGLLSALGDTCSQLGVKLGLATWVAAGLGMVVLGGKVGARFHLLYLPAAWGLAALNLTQASTWRFLGERFYLRFLVIAFWAAHVALAGSILTGATGDFSRTKFLTLFVLTSTLAAALDLVYGRWSQWGPRVLGLFAAVVVIGAMLWGGPWQWGTWSRFEPMGGSDELTALDGYRANVQPWPAPERGTLSIYLCNYYKELGHAAKALSYGRRAVAETPDSVLAWTYLGFAAELAGLSHHEQTEIWTRALALKPDSELLQQKLAHLQSNAGMEINP